MTIDLDQFDDLDVQELLARRRQVAVIWGTEDVHSVRSDLSDDQAWEVLQECRRQHDCNWGFTWQFIEDVAEYMFEKPDDEE